MQNLLGEILSACMRMLQESETPQNPRGEDGFLQELSSERSLDRTEPWRASLAQVGIHNEYSCTDLKL